MVVRNLTSLVRLLDVLPLLDADPRIGISFTLDRGSVFTGGLDAQLARLRIELIEWDNALELRFDLVIAAHVNQSLACLNGPLMVVPHGAGYNRKLPWRTADPDSPVGLSRQELVSGGRVIPEVIGLSHEYQLEQLHRSCPEALDHAVVIGDPTWDRILANKVRRHVFRQQLGVNDAQRLVLVSSTWGKNSLIGQQDRLVERLLAQLPVDEFRVALVLHPNIWAYHGASVVRAWLRDALDSGLVVIWPEDSWQAAVIAADVGIGDHGSVAFYGAGLGYPFLCGGCGQDDLTEHSTTRTMIGDAERVEVEGDLRAQIESAFMTHDGGHLSAIAKQALGAEGHSWAILQAKLYEILELSAASSPPRMLAIRTPDPLFGQETTAFDVTAFISGVSANSAMVQLERFPGLLREFRHAGDAGDYYCVVDDREADSRLRAEAGILVRSTPAADSEARTWMRQALDGTGVELAAVLTHNQCLLATRDGHVLRALSQQERGGPHPLVPAAAVGAWLRSGRRIGETLKLRVLEPDSRVRDLLIEHEDSARASAGGDRLPRPH